MKTTGTDKTSFEAILKQVIKNQGLEGKDARTQFARAVDAFEAQENNALLRSWEYTLATFSGARIAARNISALKNAIIEAKIPGSKEKLLDGINDVLESVPDIGSKKTYR